MRTRQRLAALLAVVLSGSAVTVAASLPSAAAADTRSRATLPVGQLHTQSGWFVDQTGRVVVLHGGTTGQGSTSTVPLSGSGWSSGKDAAYYQYVGFNTMRIGERFGGLMPTAGNIDPAYLAKIVSDVNLFTSKGLYVTVDFHQDCLSGWPSWALVSDGLATGFNSFPFCYFSSPAIGREYENIWANRKVTLAAPSPRAGEQEGIEDLYVAGLAATAKALRDNDHVIGIDTFNEPSPGENCNSTIQANPATGAIEGFYGVPGAAFPPIPGLVLDPRQWTGGTTFIPLALTGPNYSGRGLVVPAGESCRTLKTTILSQLMNKVAPAVHSAAPNMVIFGIGMIYDAPGALPVIAPNPAPANRNAIAIHLYAPTPTNNNNYNGYYHGTDYLAQELQNVAQYQRRHPDTAVLDSEWGNFANQNLIEASATEQNDALIPGWQSWLQSDPIASHSSATTFAAMTDRTVVPDGLPAGCDPNPQDVVPGSNPPVTSDSANRPTEPAACIVNNVAVANRNALGTPFPQATAGTPESLNFDYSSHVMTYSFSTTGPGFRHYGQSVTTAIYVPAFQYPDGYKVTVLGATVTSAPNATLLTLVNNPAASGVAVRIIPS